ncbi:MAG TPA: DNA polymerase domain-containing protein [Kofleriaceae bacterium]
MTPTDDDWLWGWDPTPGIVSVWAEGDGRVHVWRRVEGALVHDEIGFRPWLLCERDEGLTKHRGITVRALSGDGSLRYFVRGDNMQSLTTAVLRSAREWLGHSVGHLRDLGTMVHTLGPEEQYLVASGRTYFKDLPFANARRMQFDLETTGLDPQHDRIFMIAVRDPDGRVDTLEGEERSVIEQLIERVLVQDPDIIENHNLHGFDLPFLDTRAKKLGVPLTLGRIGGPGLRQRGARRGITVKKGEDVRKVRLIAPGRELIDTLDAVIRYDFAARDLPGHGLKAVARHLGLAGPDREHIRGDQIWDVYQHDPERVRRYARADVEEVAGVAAVMSGAAYALAQIAPRRYERLADAGPATGVIDPLLVRAYVRGGEALPAHVAGDGTQHQGAALHLFHAGVARRVVKADVASLYPSLMRQFQIGPARDRRKALLTLVDRIGVRRLAAKAAAKVAPPGSSERHTHEAMSAALKLLVNSAYGYLGAGGLTRFSDIHAANEVTRRGRETLSIICDGLAERGVTLLEADTDGVYFSVPDTWTTEDEARCVAEVAALLPPLVQLELEGRYAAMLSHEPKNYALLEYDGELILRGVAFRSSRAEPYGETFLRTAIERLFANDVPGVRAAYLAVISALRRHELPTHDVTQRVRLTKTPDEYMATRDSRRDLTYEALIASGRTTWSVGERIRVYRTARGGGGVLRELEDDEVAARRSADPRDYDADHYVRVLRDNFASRLSRAFAPDDFAAVFAGPDQLDLFAPNLANIRPVLTPMTADAADGDDEFEPDIEDMRAHRDRPTDFGQHSADDRQGEDE